MKPLSALPLSLGLLVFALSPWATAQPVDLEALYQRGADLREQQHDAEALELFRQVWERGQWPRALAQLSLAEGGLGRWVEAERDLLRALTFTRDRWISRHRASLRQALTTVQGHLGSLEVSANVPRAELWLEGRRVASLPSQALRVTAGSATFEVRAQGFVSVTRPYTVAPGGLARESVTLAREPIEPPAPPPPSVVVAERRDPTPEAVPHPVRAQLTPGPRPRPARGSPLRTLGWVGVGATGVAAALGVVGWVVQNGAARTYNTSGCDPLEASTAAESEVCRRERGAAETAEMVYYAGLISAGALGVTSVVLLLAAPSTSERPAPARVTLAPGPGAAGLGLRWTF